MNFLNRFKSSQAQRVYCVLLLVFLSVLSAFLVLSKPIQTLKLPDSEGYLYVANQMKTGQQPDLTLKTIGYPLFLVATTSEQAVLSVQMALFGLSIGLIFLILEDVLSHFTSRNRLVALLLSLFLVFNPSLQVFQQLVLSETLALFLISLTVLLLVKSLTADPKFVFGAFLSALLLVLVNPVFVNFPLVVVALFGLLKFLLKQDAYKKLFKYSLIGFVLYIVLVQVYCGINYSRYHFWGLTNLGQVNMLGKMAQYGYLDRRYDPNVYPKVLDSLAQANIEANYSKNPWDMISKVAGFYNPSAVEGLNVALSYLMQAYFPDFVLKSFTLVPLVMVSQPVFYAGSMFSGVWTLFYSIFVWARLLLLVILFGWGIWKLFTEHQIAILSKYLPMFVLGIVPVYLAVANSFTAYSEYYRLGVPAELIFNGFFLCSLAILILNSYHLIKKR